MALNCGLRPTLARGRRARLTWTCVQRCSGCSHTVRWRDAAQPSPGGDLPQGAHRGHRDAAGVVVRRPDGARRRGARQGGPGHGLHLLLVQEPPDRRGVPGPGAPGAVLHRCQRLHEDARGQGAAGVDPCGRRRTRGGGGLHHRTARRRQRRGGPCRARPDRRRDPQADPLGRRPGCGPAHRVGPGDDVLRRAGQCRQRRLHLPPDRRPPHLRGRAHPGEDR